jgi:hypothetical protein
LEKHLHIIDFTIPYPVDYGGVFDLFYKLPALQAAGVHIHLHCFEDDKGEQPVLNNFCESVHYYPRNYGHKGFSNTLPYIVSSRKNEKLLQNLLQDDYPIFMEGVHCTYLLNDKRFENRRCFLRVHNVEYLYYRDLCRSTSSPVRKLYYWLESRLLYRYEKKIANKATCWGVTEKDDEIYRKQLGCKDIEHLSLYLPDWKVQGQEGMGNYCLYHGDLSIDANEKAATWLLENVFNHLKVPFVIAGKNPSEKLITLAHQHNYSCIVANPSEKEMQDMIGKAHINILPSFTHTGIKLKLINALFNGRHCVVNPATVDGSGLEAACHSGSTAIALRDIVAQLYHQPFTADEINLRKNLLYSQFNNEANAKKQVGWIWGA